MRVDEAGWLVAEADDPRVVTYPTVRTYALKVPAPLGMVWHWTGGTGGGGFAERLARRAQTYRRGVERPASWHVLVARDGTIYQSAPFLVGAWHVGAAGVIAGRRFANINRATVGCELENAGRLRRIGKTFYCWPFWSNPGAPKHERRADPRLALDPGRVRFAIGEGAFDDFPLTQQFAALKLVTALVHRFGWTRDACAYGHTQFDPRRREDPGPLWSGVALPRVLDNVFGEPTLADPPAEA